MPENPLIDTLREAVNLSPDNGPLRRHFAQTLLSGGYAADAEVEFRIAIELTDPSIELQSGLVDALYRQGKNDEALGILREIQEQSGGLLPAPLMLLHARVLVADGNAPLAIGEYLMAIDRDASLADPELAATLGLASDDPAGVSAAADHESGNQKDGGSIDVDPPVDSAKDDAEPEPESEENSIADDVDAWIRLGADGEEIGVEAQSNKGGDLGWDEDDGESDDIEVEELERPNINFTDVGGMAAVKEEINIKIIQPMLHPDLYAAYGKAAGGGILMYGPPGCGKTHLARATAGEVRAKFISIGINDVLDMYLGNSEQKLHELFQLARRHTPCVLFFDEVDALGASRTDMRHSAGRHLINQFLSELDGVDANNDGILILAATNAPWHLDSAFRRPGRFDRLVFVPPPDSVARGEILRILLHGKPAENVDFAKLGKKLKDLSGADLKALVDTTIEDKLREAMKQGSPSPITTRDLQKAAKQIRPTTKEWFQTARNYALYSNESGLYDDILDYLNIKK